MADPTRDHARLHAIVHGRVQGVNFRAFTAEHARRLGLVGAVRNLDDGQSVEVIAEGERRKLAALLIRLREGPRFARVDQVEVAWPAPSGLAGEFRVIA
jgi:acylphosphatase